MSISIIVCTRNRSEKLRRCLHALLRAELDCVLEIIVLDQSDQPLEWRALDEPNLDHLRYVWQKGRGLAKARNQALHLAKGDIISFTDDDCIVTPSWASSLQQSFQTHPEADGVFGRVLPYIGRSDEMERHEFATPFGVIPYVTKPGPLFCGGLIDKPNRASYNQPAMTVEQMGSGNNMSFRRTVFEQQGLFFTQLGAGRWLKSGEDTEFHYRLLRAHYTLIYDPDVVLYHDSWLTPTQNAALQDGYTSGMLATFVFFALNADPLARDYLRYRWSSVKQEITVSSGSKSARKPMSFYSRRAIAFLKGILGGVWLALFVRKPPQLAAKQKSDPVYDVL
jgi:glycosyltransferase involved in cell wall biosynthesis